MTQFSSKPPFNDDPFPYISSHGSRHAFLGTLGGERLILDPRPEYIVIPSNPTNPILTEFRKLHAETGNDLWTDAYLFSSGLWEDYEKYDADQWFHATNVLGGIIRMERMSR